MLDVHRPHEAVHMCESFAIHIAAITIGLLIAVGIEHSVDFVHHRHQLQEAQRALAVELEANGRVLNKNVQRKRKTAADMDADTALLRAPKVPRTAIGPKLVYQAQFFWPIDAT